MNAKRRVIIFIGALLFFIAISGSNVFAQQPEYSTIRLKIFHLLNLAPGPPPGSPPTPQGPAPGPGVPPLATPTPAVKHTIITYKGNQVGQATYEASRGYQMTADIPETPLPTFNYYAWLKRTNPDNVVRLNDATLTSFRIAYVNSQDMSDYTTLVITEEPTGSAPPAGPTNEKYSATQSPLIPTPGPTSGTTQAPTPGTTQAPQPTAGGSPQPTGQGPSIDDQIRSVISNVSEAKIREYLVAVSNKDGQTDEKQTRFSGTPGNLEEQAYIIKFFQDLGYEVDTTQEYSYTYGTTQITTKNIIARLYGQKRDSFYLLTAHMDSTAEIDGSIDPAPGVNDNGSGTASVMEIARAFKQANIQPQHSIEFILFSGEEQNLKGSTDYVSKLAAEKKVRAVINLDMIGNIDPQGDCVNFYFKPGTGGNLITDVIVKIMTDFNIDLKGKSDSWGLTRSDHGPFWSAGINTAIFGHECNRGEEGPGVYHRLNDKLNAVSVPQITKAAQAVGGALVKMSQEGIGQQVTNELNLIMMQQLSAGISYDPRYMLIPNLANSFDQRLAEVQSRMQSNSSSGIIRQAQAIEGGVILAVVPFTDLTEIDVLFANVSTSIDYLMGEDLPQPQFLGLFTQQQISALQEKGYEPRIVDQNTDMRQYVFLYHPQPNQGDKLKIQGEVFEVAPNYFLLKLAPGVVHSHEGVLGEFFDLTLPQNIAPPPYRTVRITLAPTPVENEEPSSDVVPSKSQLPLLIALLLGIILLVAVGLILFIRIRKAQQLSADDEASNIE